MIITRTPYRVSFFGGGSDYPEWYHDHGGAALAATIDKYCWIAVRPPTVFGPKFKIVYSAAESAHAVEFVIHPAVRECLKELGFADKGCEVHHWSDLPARSGMGSSSAFVVGLLRALYVLAGKGPGLDIPHLATKIERDVLKETVGDQDQLQTYWGGLNVLKFGGGGFNAVSRALRPDARSAATLRELNGWLMLFYTGVQRTASDVAAGYVKDMCKDTDYMKKLVGFVERGQKALQKSDLHLFGRLLHESWDHKRKLKGASSAKIDEAYAAARKAGALGGKVLGAGGGGFLLLCVAPANQGAVKAAIADMRQVPFAFEDQGCQVVLQ